MIKDEIVAAVSKNTGYSRYLVDTVVDSLLYNITKALADGERVQFAGFGTFEPKARAPRTGRNPHTNEAVPIPARVVPAFKAGTALKYAVTKPIE